MHVPMKIKANVVNPADRKYKVLLLRCLETFERETDATNLVMLKMIALK